MSGYPILDLSKEEIFELVCKQIENYREIIEEGKLVDAKLEWLKSIEGLRLSNENDAAEVLKSDLERGSMTVLGGSFSLVELIVNGNIPSYMGFSGLPSVRKVDVRFSEGYDVIDVCPYSQGEIFMGCTHSPNLQFEIIEKVQPSTCCEGASIEDYHEHISKPYTYSPLVSELDRAQKNVWGTRRIFSVTRQEGCVQNDFEMYFYYLLPHTRFTANGSRPQEMFFEMIDYCKEVHLRKKRYKTKVLPSIECMATFRYRSAERVDESTLEWWKEFELDEIREEFSEVWGGGEE